MSTRSPQSASSAPSLIVALALGVASFGLSGCGGVVYLATVSSATSKFEEAEKLGAERLAPYPYWYAHEHLEKAKEEAANAEYGDAIDYADLAEEWAEKAIQGAKEARDQNRKARLANSNDDTAPPTKAVEDMPR